ncbi:hypothetical protein BV25DRAFT_1228828 [Artomyces pyxidatus]|uniref:Uncharacterized protein n=1 Tax=Artomyces pyxidatus TaxID=48021 RepID=A0ACB8SRK7_9AGAM|nr:hypothetical protein BV25DRAFT_1228828 [Artomyces pyxidatus]
MSLPPFHSRCTLHHPSDTITFAISRTIITATVVSCVPRDTYHELVVHTSRTRTTFIPDDTDLTLKIFDAGHDDPSSTSAASEAFDREVEAYASLTFLRGEDARQYTRSRGVRCCVPRFLGSGTLSYDADAGTSRAFSARSPRFILFERIWDALPISEARLRLSEADLFVLVSFVTFLATELGVIHHNTGGVLWSESRGFVLVDFERSLLREGGRVTVCAMGLRGKSWADLLAEELAVLTAMFITDVLYYRSKL